MQATAQDLFSQLLEFGENARLEAKRGSQISDSVMQTVCAFANEPGLEGGYLLLGVSEPDAQHDNYHVSGVTDVDQLLNELHNNCRSQFEQPVFIQAQAVMLQGRQAICVFVPELENPQKPCVFKGRFDSKNKRKTGVWRRGSNGDYECGFAELTPLLKLQQGQTFERTVFDDALWDDLDPDVIALYRRLRAQVRPKAEELQGTDEEMLLAMRLLERTDKGLQPSDQPLLPYKVVREAVVNMVMHRDYAIHQPSIIVRYRNRIETLNAGYSLKAVEQLGETGSILRNPILANVLYDLEFAEVKGTGIRTMRRMLKEAGLEAPVFVNHVIQDQFKAIYLLHQLMGEEQLAWLAHFSRCKLSEDEAKALILAREIGAVDNAAIRAVSDLDTLATSQVLRRLHHGLGLLTKGGAGSATYYQLNQEKIARLVAEHGELATNASVLDPKGGDLGAYAGELELPQNLLDAISRLSERPRKEVLWPIILRLCSVAPMSSNQIANKLGRLEKHLKANHLTKMRKEGLLNYLYPEVVNHPQQAYVITEQGKAWLKTHKE